MSRPHTPGSRLWGQALILSLGAAVSLGVTRFAYGLLLPPMRESLEWSYTLAGAMNTANAAGYLLCALLMPRLLRRWPPGAVLRMGMALAALFMALSGFVTDAGMLMVQRLLAGWASALVFVTGGLLAARLAQQRPQQGGWLIGLYYGGTGWGIVVSTWVVPWVLTVPHDWPRAWWVLACTCALALMALWRTVGQLDQQQGQAAVTRSEGAIRFELSQWLFGLAGYACFGMGYIGYMTFVIALLRAQGASGSSITVFYSALGLAVVLFAFAGWRYWDSSRDEAATAAAKLGQQMVTAQQRLIANPDDKAANTELQRLGRQIIDEYGSTPYAIDASLLLARRAVDQGDLAGAAKQLRATLDMGLEADTEVVVRTRLARVLAAQKQFDAALAELAEVLRNRQPPPPPPPQARSRSHLHSP